jgi:hypothetical protein
LGIRTASSAKIDEKLAETRESAPASAKINEKLAGARESAPAGSRARGTSMGGLYVAATLQALLEKPLS